MKKEVEVVLEKVVMLKKVRVVGGDSRGSNVTVKERW